MRATTSAVLRDGTPLQLALLEARHLHEVALLHQQALPAALLSQLGPAFLRRLYRGIARAPDSMVCVAESPDGRALGFVCGTGDVARCYRSTLLHELPGLTATSIGAITRSPRLWRAMFETLSYPLRRVPVGGASASDRDVRAELLSMAVSERARGMGLGRALIHALDLFLAGRPGAIDRYRVVTDALDERSNAFYRNVGFTFVRQLTHHGHPMNLYHRTTPSDRGHAHDPR